MRNWNYWRGINITSYPASRLPMRNWNLLSFPRRCASELPDYLWGIETREGRDRSRGCFRFQTTYEELKHNGKHRLYRSFGTASRLPMRNWNKYFSVPSGFLAGFQTTYEELKLPPPSVNSHTFPQLPDYLWGIETLAVGFLVVVAMVLPDYLWGIETRKRRNHCRQFGFQTTYEELKL